MFWVCVCVCVCIHRYLCLSAWPHLTVPLAPNKTQRCVTGKCWLKTSIQEEISKMARGTKQCVTYFSCPLSYCCLRPRRLQKPPVKWRLFQFGSWLPRQWPAFFQSPPWHGFLWKMLARWGWVRVSRTHPHTPPLDNLTLSNSAEKCDVLINLLYRLALSKP